MREPCTQGGSNSRRQAESTKGKGTPAGVLAMIVCFGADGPGRPRVAPFASATVRSRPASAAAAGGARARPPMSAQMRRKDSLARRSAQRDNVRFGQLGDESAGIHGWDTVAEFAADGLSNV